MNLLKMFTYAVMAICIFFATANQTRLYFLSFQEPYDLIKAVILTPQIKIAQPLRVQYFFYKNRFCDTKIFWFVETEDKTIVWRFEQLGGATGLGERSPINGVPIPVLPIGKYTLRTRVNDECTDGKHSANFNEVDFEVVK